MANNVLCYKNKRTGKNDKIVQHDLQRCGYGFYFLVENELDAYKVAFLYKHVPFGVSIDYSTSRKMWLVTVYSKHIDHDERDKAVASAREILKQAGLKTDDY